MKISSTHHVTKTGTLKKNPLVGAHKEYVEAREQDRLSRIRNDRDTADEEKEDELFRIRHGDDLE